MTTTDVAVLEPEELEPDAQAAHELRLSGASWPAIVKRLGFPDPEHAQVAVYSYQRAQLIARDDERKAVDMAIELERLDTLQAGWWDLAVSGFDEKAANVVLKCIAQRSKLLGLEIPTQATHTEHTVTVIKGESQVYIETLKRVVEAGAS